MLALFEAFPQINNVTKSDIVENGLKIFQFEI